MNKMRWLPLMVLVTVSATGVLASHLLRPELELEALNKRLQGKVVDYTSNHGKDQRLWARSLHQRRDMYVYLPPRFDPNRRYPLVIFLHGFNSDERTLLKVIPQLDRVIAGGWLPPVIVAAPDGSLDGNPDELSMGSFFLNTTAGNYEDFIVQDVLDFMAHTYPICQERQAHVLAGNCMGGFAAYSLGMRHRESFGVLVGVSPLLNLRWVDKENHYLSNFDPYNWGWRRELNPREVIGKLGNGRGFLRVKDLTDAVFGRDAAMEDIMEVNPIELIDRTKLRNGDLAMYVGYGGKDEYNVDAQVESFLYTARFRRLGVAVGYEPEGHHDLATGYKLMPEMCKWLTPLLARFSPPLTK